MHLEAIMISLFKFVWINFAALVKESFIFKTISIFNLSSVNKK
ncbi:hypothetical protein C5L30_001160 [Companilactobacillus farciminis]|uniref:Uncharacterized protein n=1 Tax=Companilactobacillus farciminis TaxID=1612 RepID=A0A4R5NFF8_9LACO|nr:hypothetical protein C5L30_001160 [Companilactobacillus farciminis]